MMIGIMSEAVSPGRRAESSIQSDLNVTSRVDDQLRMTIHRLQLNVKHDDPEPGIESSSEVFRDEIPMQHLLFSPWVPKYTKDKDKDLA